MFVNEPESQDFHRVATYARMKGIHVQPILIEVRKRTKIRNRYNKAPHLTKNTNWESDSFTIRHHKQESQEASPLSEGDHEASINRCTRKHNRIKTETTQMYHKRSTTLERSLNILLEGQNRLHGAPTSPLVHIVSRTLYRV